MRKWIQITGVSLACLYTLVFMALAGNVVCRYNDETYNHMPIFDTSQGPLPDEIMPRLHVSAVTFDPWIYTNVYTNGTNAPFITNVVNSFQFTLDGTNYKQR